MTNPDKGTYWTQKELEVMIRKAIRPVRDRLDQIASNIDVIRNGWGPYIKDEDYDTLKAHITETADLAERGLQGQLLLDHMVWEPGEVEQYRVENRHSPELNTVIDASCPGHALEQKLDSFAIENADVMKARELELDRWERVDDHRFADYKIVNTATGEPFYFQYGALEPTGVTFGDQYIKHTGDWWGVDNPDRPKSEDVQLTESIAWLEGCRSSIYDFVPVPEMLKDEVNRCIEMECVRILQDGMAEGADYSDTLGKLQMLIQVSSGEVKSVHGIGDVHSHLASVAVDVETSMLPVMEDRLKQIQCINRTLTQGGGLSTPQPSAEEVKSFTMER